MGVQACLKDNVCRLQAARVSDAPPDAALSGDIRTSVLLAGPVLRREAGPWHVVDLRWPW